MTSLSSADERASKEILITGFGGQGVVLAGQILGKAASLEDQKQCTLTQSYGPEARGGACNAQVIIAEGTIHYPYVRHPDILVCLSQGGYDKHIHQLKAEGTLLVDDDLVHPPDPPASKSFSIPSTRMAEELGRRMMANIVMLGFVTAVTGVVTVEAMRKTVVGSVPKGTEQLNLTAFNKGHDFGLATLKGRQKKASGQGGTQP